MAKIFASWVKWVIYLKRASSFFIENQLFWHSPLEKQRSRFHHSHSLCRFCLTHLCCRTAGPTAGHYLASNLFRIPLGPYRTCYAFILNLSSRVGNVISTVLSLHHQSSVQLRMIIAWETQCFTGLEYSVNLYCSQLRMYLTLIMLRTSPLSS